MLRVVCRACVLVVAWINGVLFGCAEDAAEALRGGGFAAEADEGFQAGVRWARQT